MSDEQTLANGHIKAPKPLVPPIDLRAAHYARLLFGEGAKGWCKNDHGNYMRIVYPPKGKKFTQADLDAGNAVLLNESGTKNLNIPLGDFCGDYMVFTITPEDMEWLKEYGLKQNEAGVNLRRPDQTVIRRDPIDNDPLHVLHENLRMAVLDRDSWVDSRQQAFLRGERQRFLDQLDKILPQLRDNDSERKEAIREQLSFILKDIPVTVNILDGADASVVTLIVNSAYYDALENVIAVEKLKA